MARAAQPIDIVSVAERRRRFPLSSQRYQIGVLAVAALVLLRLALGFHFLYEGAWKISPFELFATKPQAAVLARSVIKLQSPAPTQLFAQRAVVGVAGVGHQFELRCRPLHAHPIKRLQRA